MDDVIAAATTEAISHRGYRGFLHSALPIILLMLVAAGVLLPRGLEITRAESERVDDEYHLVRGIEYLRGNLERRGDLALNDPPLGEGLTVLPLWLARCWRGAIDSALYGHVFGADAILNWTGLWKSLLFLPGLAVAFAWSRRVYGKRAAWLSALVLLTEPNFAAHIPLPTLDVLGVEAILIASFLCWQYFEKPSRWRLVAAAFSIAAALLTKHTAILLPLVFVAYTMLWWRRRRKGGELEPAAEGKRSVPMQWCGRVAIFAVTLFLTIWAFCGFDFQKPALPEHLAEHRPYLVPLTHIRLPASLYVSSFLEGMTHADSGQRGFLFGEKRKSGWWYYFPVVATFKVPIPLLGLFALTAASYFWKPLAWEEWGLLVPLVGWTGLMMSTKVNIGFRHFLPAYLFMILLASRVAAVGPKWAIAGFALAIAAAIHAWTFHPDCLAYLNAPRHQAYMDINDSNIDWGQGLKAARKWIEEHPSRTVFVRDFGWGPARLFNVRKCIGSAGHVIDRGAPLPREGVLIISAVPLAGVYERSDPFRVLRAYEPDAVLAHCMMVYDLDRLRGGNAFHWPPYKEPPPAEVESPGPASVTPQNKHPEG